MFGWRPGIVYAYSTIDPKTNRRVRWAYVGQTRQSLAVRHNQHMGFVKIWGKYKPQPWSDLYPEVRVVWQFDSCPNWWLTLFEKYTIKTMRPIYNYNYNTRNRRRIPLFTAIEQRKQRDRARRLRRLTRPLG